MPSKTPRCYSFSMAARTIPKRSPTERRSGVRTFVCCTSTMRSAKAAPSGPVFLPLGRPSSATSMPMGPRAGRRCEGFSNWSDLGSTASSLRVGLPAPGSKSRNRCSGELRVGASTRSSASCSDFHIPTRSAERKSSQAKRSAKSLRDSRFQISRSISTSCMRYVAPGGP
jgi:hypothetical protein